MDRILIILKKENGPRASSAPALVLNTIIFKYVYSYMKQISGERLQDHWSSGLNCFGKVAGRSLLGEISTSLDFSVNFIILYYYYHFGRHLPLPDLICTR